jgi:prolyl-tRNA editing enzyme YbaK/EbsC (Cys-tRNA(Pro) deacylase)
MNDDKSATQKELDAEEAALRSEAESIDPVRPTDAEIPDEKTEAETRAPANAKQPAKSAARPGGDKQPAAPAADPAASKTTKTESPEAKDKSKPAEADESKLTPFQKERRRMDESWKRLEADKAEVRRQQEQHAAERRQWEQQRTTASAKAATDANAAKAEDYEAIAKEFEAEGKLKQAEHARAKARELREQPGAGAGDTGAPRERFTVAEQARIAQDWQANLDKLGKELPELTQEGTPLRKLTADILAGTPLLHTDGHGIVLAVAHARVRIEAEGLKAKVGELEKEIERLTGLTSLPSGGASPAAQSRKFDELTLAEQEAELREAAEQAA